MKVSFKSAQILGGKAYAKGTSIVPDRHVHSMPFKKLVKAGKVVIAPRSASEITGQAAKDSFAVHNAAKAAKAAQPSTLDAHNEAKAEFAKKAG
jgi:hypothetical protein